MEKIHFAQSKLHKNSNIILLAIPLLLYIFIIATYYISFTKTKTDQEKLINSSTTLTD